MADLKISQLTDATTPLAGTEVLPIVQSSATKKVAVSDLTAGRTVSASTFTSTVATGTSPFTIGSTTNVANLNASSLNGATFAAPGTIGGGTASAATFTAVTLSGTSYALTATAASALRKAGSFGNTGGTLDFGVESSAGGALFTNAGAYTGNIGTAGNTDFNLCSNGTVRATVTTAGNLSLATGNVVIGTSGKGIDFSATSQAGGMTSELLADYEEGTWTPSCGGNTTYNTQQGYYTRIGRQVTAWFFIDINAIGSGTNNRFSGLPFTNNANQLASGSIGYFANLAVNEIFLSCYVNGGSTTVSFTGRDAASASMTNLPTVIGNSTQIYGQVIYFV